MNTYSVSSNIHSTPQKVDQDSFRKRLQAKIHATTELCKSKFPWSYNLMGTYF